MVQRGRQIRRRSAAEWYAHSRLGSLPVQPAGQEEKAAISYQSSLLFGSFQNLRTAASIVEEILLGDADEVLCAIG